MAEEVDVPRSERSGDGAGAGDRGSRAREARPDRAGPHSGGLDSGEPDRAESDHSRSAATGAPPPAVDDYDVLSPACPSRTVLRHVVDRWTPLVVAVLIEGPRRFGELRAAVGGITPKVLTETLRSMERDGLVTREQTPGVPPRVDYALTPLGVTLAEPMEALRAWAQGHAEEILANRAQHDAATPFTETGGKDTRNRRK